MSMNSEIRRYLKQIGKRGGVARSKALSPARRIAIASIAGSAPKKRRAKRKGKA